MDLIYNREKAKTGFIKKTQNCNIKNNANSVWFGLFIVGSISDN
jgi:hypothetical protein